MENIILRQGSSLGGRTSSLTELMPSDILEYNTADEKMCHLHSSHGFGGHDAISGDRRVSSSNPNEMAQSGFALQMNPIPFRDDIIHYNNPLQFSTCLLQ